MDLWVLPPAAESKWFARLDWYLNWQMCKGLAFQPVAPSVEMIRVIKETEFNYEAPPEASASPLLVYSAGRLPALRCLVLNCDIGLQAWLEKIHTLGINMKAKGFRIFLPRGADKEQALKYWGSLEPRPGDVQFSTDEDFL